MLIVLEGCDATGKSTLAKMLAPLLNAQIVHCTTETPNTFEFFRDIVYASERNNIIADRFCYGQFVYQDSDERPINSGEFDDEWDALYNLECRMLRYNTKLIYCYTDTNVIIDRMINRGENPMVPEDIKDIQQNYANLWTRTLIQPIYFRT